MFECSPDCDSGISSSTTTYSIAPAAKESKYGRIVPTNPVKSIVIIAPIGSTIPDNIPYINAFVFETPSDLSGIEIIAPSGKFCIAIPIASARAPVKVIPAFPFKAPAKDIPTAIPLW